MLLHTRTTCSTSNNTQRNLTHPQSKKRTFFPTIPCATSQCLSVCSSRHCGRVVHWMEWNTRRTNPRHRGKWNANARNKETWRACVPRVGLTSGACKVRDICSQTKITTCWRRARIKDALKRGGGKGGVFFKFQYPVDLPLLPKPCARIANDWENDGWTAKSIANVYLKKSPWWKFKNARNKRTRVCE